MSTTTEALESQILQLPASERRHLLDRVVASLDVDAARDEAWDAIAARRDAEIEQGLSQTIPLDDVLARLRAEAGQ